MAWMQPQLTEPAMHSELIAKIQHRLTLAYPVASQAVELGVTETGTFDQPTKTAVINFQKYVNEHKLQTPPLIENGIADYATQVRMGATLKPVAPPVKRFVQQGVGFSTDAFGMGNATHSYVMAVREGIAELNRICLPMVGVPKIPIGYSMGDDIVNQWLMQWPADRRDEIRLVVGFGCPSRPPGPTLLGNNPPGAGISSMYTPEWARDRTYQFINDDGDMYPEAVGVLPQMYQILTQMAFNTEFIMYLFNMLTSSFGPVLLGTVTSAIPGAGALSGLLGLVTPGATSSTTGPVNLLAMLTNITGIIQALMAALTFLATNAHYHYHDTPKPYWRGLTAVDCAAQIITEKVERATVLTIPGTVSWWNDGPPAWTAWKLP